MKTQVPRSVTEVYVDFIRSPDAANLSGCITYGNLNKLIVAKYPFLEPVWQYVVSCRVWVNLKNLPDTDSAYVAERRWLEERIHLTSWIEGPNGGGTRLAQRETLQEDAAVSLRTVNYADLELRIIPETVDYHRNYIEALRVKFQEEQFLAGRFKNISSSSLRDINRWPKFEAKRFPQPTKKVITMNVNKPYENISYVYGVEAATASDAHLIDSLRRVDAEIGRLADLKSNSTKVEAMIKSLEADKNAIVATLDSRP